MRSFAILCTLVCLGACKQFTLSESDEKILEESDQLMKEHLELTESSTIRSIHKMNATVQAGGNKPLDVKELERTAAVWNKYKKFSSRLKVSMPPDSIVTIDLFKASTSNYEDEIKRKVSLPFGNFPYYNITQLRLELALNFDEIVNYLRTRVGTYHWFEPIRLVIVENTENTQLYLLMREQGDLYSEVIIPLSHRDSLQIQDLISWTSVEYADRETVSVSYFNEMGELKVKEFAAAAKILKIN